MRRNRTGKMGKSEYGMLFILIIVGIILFSVGIKGKINLNKEMKNYKSVDGFFAGTRIVSGKDPRDGSSNVLIYRYTVNGNTYNVETDYGTNILPKDGSSKTIKYNPDDPSMAIISGMGGNEILIFVGFFFVFISIMILKPPKHGVYID